MIDYNELGKRIKEERNIKKFTQEYIAEKIKKSIKHISSIENGKTKPSLDTIADIANILETSVDKLLVNSTNKILVDNEVYLKVRYNKEVKELLDDLNHEELKLIIETIKFNKETIRKAGKVAKNEK